MGQAPIASTEAFKVNTIAICCIYYHLQQKNVLEDYYIYTQYNLIYVKVVTLSISRSCSREKLDATAWATSPLTTSPWPLGSALQLHRLVAELPMTIHPWGLQYTSTGWQQIAPPLATPQGSTKNLHRLNKDCPPWLHPRGLPYTSTGWQQSAPPGYTPVGGWMIRFATPRCAGEDGLLKESLYQVSAMGQE